MKNDTIEIHHADSDLVETREMTDEEQAWINKARADAEVRIAWRDKNESRFDTYDKFVEAYQKHFGLS